MNLGRVDEALGLVRRLRSPLSAIEGVDVVLCPPFVVLGAVAEILDRSSIDLGGQNMHWEEKGAHTGDISAPMLASLCQYVILGHSERRATGSEAESDAAIRRKVEAALNAGLTPIVCVGEDAERNQAGETAEFVGGQVHAATNGLAPDSVARCVFAYEPIWAIGSGRSASPAEANRTIGLTVRGTIAHTFGESVATRVRVQYGGSVTAENIGDFMRMPEIDGALVGGAGLKPTFVDLVSHAAEAAAGS
jgi:triosephosphate isomerase